MKRRTRLNPGDKPLRRRTPLTARLGLRRGAPLERGGSLSPSNSVTNPHGVAGRKPRRNTGFDPLTADLILVRDELRCQACGVSILGRDFSRQHRCARGAGGRGRDHPWIGSPMNGILLCGTAVTGCHGLCEARDPEMHDRGFWLIEGVDFTHHPGEAPLLVAVAGGFAEQWLTPDGQRVTERPDFEGATW